MNILYHYTSSQGLMGIINSLTLHCTNIRFLNDPSETTYFQSVVDCVLEEDLRCKDTYSKLYEQIYVDNVFPYDKEYIVSFCKGSDELPLWKYYGKGNGYNIGFDIDTFVSNSKRVGIYISKQEVIYDPEVQKNIIRNFILNYQRKLDEIATKYDDGNIPCDVLDESGLIIDFTFELLAYRNEFKHPAYKDENEVRLKITHLSGEVEKKYRVSPTGVFVEYIELPFMLDHIKTITCHPEATIYNRNGVKAFLRSKGKEDDDIKVELSKIPFRNL